MMTVANVPRPRGRPREFDLERALDGAIDVFRDRGYHATSIP
jgi:AcrR family transcriptional regulator